MSELRPMKRARWATCVLALTICVPAVAKVRAKSLADCTAFDQQEKGEDAVEFTIRNACTIPVDCQIEWRVVCAPSSKKRRSVHASTSKLALALGTTHTAEASASVCGDDAWTIDSVNWSCEPNKD
jgi:hypothetical protein